MDLLSASPLFCPLLAVRLCQTVTLVEEKQAAKMGK